jgi:hypothetical protein
VVATAEAKYILLTRSNGAFQQEIGFWQVVPEADGGA